MGNPQGFDRNEFLGRIGTFFLLIGFVLLVLFFLTDTAGGPVFNYFCWSAILLVLGFVFRGQLKKTYQPSGRFNIFKRLKPKPKDDKGKK
jgi:hypothetical protein